MEPLGNDRVERLGTSGIEPTRLPVPPSRRWAGLGPLAALAFTTACLAASAFRVVASAIEEEKASTLEAKSELAIPPNHEHCVIRHPELAEPEELVDIFADDPPPPPSPPAAPKTPPPPPQASAIRVNTSPQTPPQKADGKPPSPPPQSPTAQKKSSRPPTAQSKSTPPAPSEPLPPAPKSDAKRISVRNPKGTPIVARVLGYDGDKAAVLLPDGRVGWPDGLIYTERPFVPATMEAMKKDLLEGEFAGFHALETRHYLVLYQGSRKFAQDSVTTLESLYARLGNVLNKREVPVHEAEFPLVAVIFNTEEDFRRRKRVAENVQAYYEIMSNRIYLYESSHRDQTAPEVSALRKPQTVAHEGTHQILQNIGVQPRLSNWPLWLVEGLAEYCASPGLVAKTSSPGWVGLGEVNLLHIATIRDLYDPLSHQVAGANVPQIRRDPGQTIAEYLVTRAELTPTDYALSWALTYYLAQKRVDDFLNFLREMSRLEPFAPRTPQDDLRAFKAAFGDRLPKLDKDVIDHLSRLKQIDALPYYAVVFEQNLQDGRLYRAAYVSQSPSMIRQWIETSTSQTGAEPRWQISPQSSKARALLTVQQWMGNNGG
jgi:hypothetical protein